MNESPDPRREGPHLRLAELGLRLPTVAPPLAAYVPAKRSGDHIYVSGQVPLADGKPLAVGRVGAEVDLEQARELARRCGLNALAAIDALVGLTRVVQVVKVVGFVACAPGFTEAPAVTAPAPPAQEPKEKLAIKTSLANLRAAPGNRAKIIGVLKQGTRLEVLEERDQWFRVRVEDGREGWVAESVTSAPAR